MCFVLPPSLPNLCFLSKSVSKSRFLLQIQTATGVVAQTVTCFQIGPTHHLLHSAYSSSTCRSTSHSSVLNGKTLTNSCTEYLHWGVQNLDLNLVHKYVRTSAHWDLNAKLPGQLSRWYTKRLSMDKIAEGEIFSNISVSAVLRYSADTRKPLTRNVIVLIQFAYSQHRDLTFDMACRFTEWKVR